MDNPAAISGRLVLRNEGLAGFAVSWAGATPQDNVRQEATTVPHNPKCESPLIHVEPNFLQGGITWHLWTAGSPRIREHTINIMFESVSS